MHKFLKFLNMYVFLFKLDCATYLNDKYYIRPYIRPKERHVYQIFSSTYIKI